MFVQIVKGKTSDPDAFRALGEKWQQEVRPTASGYLGSTTGVASDGSFIAVVQFTDDVAAKENSDSPAQDAWYQEFTKIVDGEPSFRESTDFAYLFDGPSPAAGFVQIMESSVADRAKAEAMESEAMQAELRQARPDLLGGLRVWLADSKVLEVAYFTSEDEARKGEESADFGSQEQAFGEVFQDMTYLDLPDPQINLA